jgi:hypothetical protein
MVVRTLFSKELLYVESVTHSSARVIPLSAYEKPITTRKGVTKMVMAHKPPYHMSASACVEIVDPQSGYVKGIQERFTMGDGTTATQTVPKNKAVRPGSVYRRTDKKPEKDMKGQGAIVFNAISARGSATMNDIVADTEGKFVGTRQSGERIVGFYLSKFKREGYVTTDAVIEGAPAAEAVAE